jgi:hypothetical protein
LNGVETIARLRQLCERWIYSACLGFALADDDRKRSGFFFDFAHDLVRKVLFLVSWPRGFAPPAADETLVFRYRVAVLWSLFLVRELRAAKAQQMIEIFSASVR